jgi:hypothetical protein
VSRYTAEMHEHARMALMFTGKTPGKRPYCVRDNRHRFAWPVYYEGENGRSAVRFATMEAAQARADELNKKDV